MNIGDWVSGIIHELPNVLQFLGPAELFRLAQVSVQVRSVTGLDGPLRRLNLLSLSTLKELDLRISVGLTNLSVGYIRYCTSLEILQLGGCHQLDARCLHLFLRHMESLRQLDISEMQFSPQDLECLPPNLLALSLSHTNIDGRGLQVVSQKATGLQYLDISSTGITGADLADLCNFTALDYLDISSTGITGEDLSDLCNNTQTISSLKINNCRNLGDQDLTALQNLPWLTSLGVHSNEALTDAAVAHVGKCSELETLSLAGCPLITDEGIKELKTLNLTTLNVMGLPKLTDALLPHLAEYHSDKIEHIILRNCASITPWAVHPFLREHRQINVRHNCWSELEIEHIILRNCASITPEDVHSFQLKCREINFPQACWLELSR